MTFNFLGLTELWLRWTTKHYWLVYSKGRKLAFKNVLEAKQRALELQGNLREVIYSRKHGWYEQEEIDFGGWLRLRNALVAEKKWKAFMAAADIEANTPITVGATTQKDPNHESL